MNADLYRIADLHVIEEFEKQRNVLEVVESGLTLATEVLCRQARGEPLPELRRPLPPADAAPIEWLDWALVAGGLRLASLIPPVEPQEERLFELVA